MKKILSIAGALIVSASAFAQASKADTTAVRGTARFEVETYKSDKGNARYEYRAILDGETYKTDKTNYKRNETALRYGVRPNIAIVTTASSKKKLIVL